MKTVDLPYFSFSYFSFFFIIYTIMNKCYNFTYHSVCAGSFVLCTWVTQVTYWLLSVNFVWHWCNIFCVWFNFSSSHTLHQLHSTSIYPNMVCSLNTSPTHFCVHGPWISGSSIRAGLYWSNYNENLWSLIKFPSLHLDVMHVCYSTYRRNTISVCSNEDKYLSLSKLRNSWHNPWVNSSFI